MCFSMLVLIPNAEGILWYIVLLEVAQNVVSGIVRGCKMVWFQTRLANNKIAHGEDLHGGQTLFPVFLESLVIGEETETFKTLELPDQCTAYSRGNV
jgi:hypothetical protein